LVCRSALRPPQKGKNKKFLSAITIHSFVVSWIAL
jgi:hypothetical protein